MKEQEIKEQEIKDLGFEIQHETIESSGYNNDWYYYTLTIGDVCLISNANDEVDKDKWDVSVFNSNTCIKNINDLKTLVNILNKSV
tara:strand:+ start:605 stop:862 length:258 start_codon:yes stop_codon:yes gene_type:complete